MTDRDGSTRESRFEAWKSRNPDIAPAIYFALKVGTPITDRVELEKAVFDKDLDVLATIQRLYEKKAERAGESIAELLAGIVPAWAEDLV